MNNTPSNFFNDSLETSDSLSATYDENPYREDGNDVSYGISHGVPHGLPSDVGSIGEAGLPLQPYQVFDHRLSIDQSSLSGGGPALGGRPGIWDGFAEPSAVETNDGIFVDPGLYGGRDQDIHGRQGARPDSVDANASSLSDVMSRVSTRRSSSNQSNSHRSNMSGSMSTDITPPDQDPPKKRKRSETDANTEAEELKRDKFLERNRLAASKCREKKKLATQELERRKIKLEVINVGLVKDFERLSAKVADLKHQLMAHAKCNDHNIDMWIASQARRFVQPHDDGYAQPFSRLGQSGLASDMPGVPTSPRSRNESIAPNFPTMPGVPLGVLGQHGEGPSGYGQSLNIPPSNPNTMPLTYQQSGSGLYTPPGGADGGYLNTNPPSLKREPDINYDHMPDDMFSDHSNFGSG